MKQVFDLDSSAFEVTYRVAAAGAGGLQSEVYLSAEYHYPNGYSVAFHPSGCCSWAMTSKVFMVLRCAPAVLAVLAALAASAARAFSSAASHAASVSPGTEITVSISANKQS